ncbi:MAG: HAD-IA family hydrolase [Clostridiaceae bacterium]|jgi:pyrophosphatase PpaX|nr:HAD-IA family hydrolase [Bacillota bacterium]NLN52055.1 HAD-IA family hydrolase [Clostridiaceae bacterium]
MQLEAILFDFDGTLFDTIPLIVESYQYVYKKFNKRFHSAEEIKAGIGLPLEEVLIGEYPDDGAEMLQEYLNFNNQHSAHRYGIFLGIGPMLDDLREIGIPLGIVTAKRYDNAKVTLETSGYREHFDSLVTKYDTDIHKPNPAPLNLGMERLGLSDPSKIMYVGDSIFDVQAAKNGNFISVAVDWTQITPDKLRAQEPEIWLNNPQELVELGKKYFVN